MNTNQLKALWQQAFGDTEQFIDRFFSDFFSPLRCRYLEEDGKILSALYWFDCYVGSRKWAYIYAVATDENHRGKGLCRKLMDDTHRHLAQTGYAGAVLVPAKDHLWNYYRKSGYTPFGSIHPFSQEAGKISENLEIVRPESYEALRAAYLPENSLDQSSLYGFYSGWGNFYRGEDFLFAAGKDGDTLYFQEFLGNAQKLPGILAALGAKTAKVRTPGGDAPCGMYLKFTEEAAAPGYLGFPLD